MIPDSQSFLFTLVNPSGNQPIKITPKTGAAIRCASDAGPTFGDSNGYYALQVGMREDRSHGVSYNSHLFLGYGFTCPENVNLKHLFHGGEPI